MVAQSSSSGAEALAILFALAIVALQIYLIYAIIATRQDVKSVRQYLLGGTAPRSTPIQPSAPPSWGTDVARLKEADELRQSGILSEDEFAQMKASILSGWQAQGQSTHAATGATMPHYSVVIESFGRVPKGRVHVFIRGYDRDFPIERLDSLPVVIDFDVSKATADMLAQDLARVGASARIVPRNPGEAVLS